MIHIRFSLLDGLRGLAAIFVVTRHTRGWNPQFFHSYLGVDIFFLLSGFVIAYAYEDRLRSSVLTRKRFIAIRIIRLYPIFFGSLALCSLLILVKHFAGLSPHENWRSIATQISFTAFMTPSHGQNEFLFPINLVYWSLCFELVINLLYSSVCKFLTLKNLLFIITVSSFLLLYVDLTHGGVDVGWNWQLTSIAGGLIRAAYGIFTGMFIHRIRAVLPVSGNAVALSALIVSIALLAAPDQGRLNAVIDGVAIFAIFPAAILMMSHFHSVRSQGFLAILGAASYPMYLLHVPLCSLTAQAFSGVMEKYSPFSGAVFDAALLLACWQLEVRVDSPLRRKITTKVFSMSRTDDALRIRHSSNS